MADIKTRGFTMPDGNTHIYIPPVATETDAGGFKAKTKTTENQEIAIDPTTGKAYAPAPDATLTQTGVAADAKVVGDELTTVKNDLNGKADVIIETASGENITITDSDSEKFSNFKIFGKSIQNGVPSPTTPVPIVNTGDKGSIKIDITGRNLIDYKKAKFYGSSKQPEFIENGIIIDTTQNYDKRIVCFFPIKPIEKGKKYIFSVNAKRISGSDNLEFYLPDISQYLGNNRVFTASANTDKIAFYLNLDRPNKFEVTNIMLREFGTDDTYETYKEPQAVSLLTQKGLASIDSVRDEITMTEHIQRIGQIASYNNEPITTDFISSTGQLTVGAQVNYVLTNPIRTPLTPIEIEEIKKLHTNYPTTIITNDVSAPMEVSYVADTKNFILNRESAMQKQISELQSALISQKISGGYKSN